MDDGAELTLKITNNGRIRLVGDCGIIPCFNPGAPADNAKKYPKAIVNPEFKNTNTWYAGQNGLAKLMRREIHFNHTLRGLVDEQAVDGEYPFTYKWPTSSDDAREGLLIRESTSGDWVTGIAWERFLSAQGHNPWSCMHLCINVGPLCPKRYAYDQRADLSISRNA